LDNKSKEAIHLGFQIGLIIKAISGIVELIGGIMFLYFPGILMGFVNFIVGGELSEDPRDVIVGMILHWVNYSLEGFRILIGVYLLIIGIAKMGFVIALLKKKLKAYVVYEWILAAFVVYQSYRYILMKETFVLLLDLMDIFVMVFIWLEYLRLKRRI